MVVVESLVVLSIPWMLQHVSARMPGSVSTTYCSQVVIVMLVINLPHKSTPERYRS